jgi:hypothetical protein
MKQFIGSPQISCAHETAENELARQAKAKPRKSVWFINQTP